MHYSGAIRLGCATVAQENAGPAEKRATTAPFLGRRTTVAK